MRLGVELLALGLALGLALPAGAAESTSSSSLSLSVASACRISSASSLSFGKYDSVGANAQSPVDGSGSVSVVCTNKTSSARVSLSQGSNPAAGSSCASPVRQMRNGRGDQLRYHIYQDANRAIPWGCTPETSYALPAFSRTLTPVQLTTFGRIPAGQLAGTGEYVDTVEVVVTF